MWRNGFYLRHIGTLEQQMKWTNSHYGLYTAGSGIFWIDHDFLYISRYLDQSAIHPLPHIIVILILYSKT